MNNLIELMQRELLESSCEGAAEKIGLAAQELTRAQFNIKLAEGDLRTARQDVLPHMKNAQGIDRLDPALLGRAAYHLSEAFQLVNTFTARIHPEPATAPAIDVPAEPSTQDSEPSAQL